MHLLCDVSRTSLASPARGRYANAQIQNSRIRSFKIKTIGGGRIYRDKTGKPYPHLTTRQAHRHTTRQPTF
ncbi:hypothetical protein [Brasilonema sp. UFV-L1]|uniref:hypothetical protein n=1 Tax=Brasilonema sp. UFV-L1 TaxID=2234130 RepID=UPI00403F127A